MSTTIKTNKLKWSQTWYLVSGDLLCSLFSVTLEKSPLDLGISYPPWKLLSHSLRPWEKLHWKLPFSEEEFQPAALEPRACLLRDYREQILLCSTPFSFSHRHWSSRVPVFHYCFNHHTTLLCLSPIPPTQLAFLAPEPSTAFWNACTNQQTSINHHFFLEKFPAPFCLNGSLLVIKDIASSVVNNNVLLFPFNP